MRNDAQYAQTVLRLLRKYGMHCTLVIVEGEQKVKVGPPAALKAHPMLREAITRVKPALIALLEAEQRNGRCAHCGAGDWGPLEATVELRDGPRHVWGCLTCHTPVEVLKAEVEVQTQRREAREEDGRR